MFGISSPAEKPQASQKRLCSMPFVVTNDVYYVNYLKSVILLTLC
jgi:hypothetical protein